MIYELTKERGWVELMPVRGLVLVCVRGSFMVAFSRPPRSAFFVAGGKVYIGVRDRANLFINL